MSLPKLLPEQSFSSVSLETSTSSVAVSDVLLRILSKLTVYQSLPEVSGSAVLAVRGDMDLGEALALILPGKVGDGPSFCHKVIEVLASAETEADHAPMLALSKSLLVSNELLSKALQAEAFKPRKSLSVGAFLSVPDLLYFFLRPPAAPLTVSEWLSHKRAEALKQGDDNDWIEFCRESTLLIRSSLSMSPGMELRKNSILSSSTMNMSVSNMLKQSTSMGDLIAPGSHSMYWKSQLRTARMGGSSLVAVCDLLSRPWQNSLPLTVQTENGVDAIFAYTTLAQLMAHVSMNCSDKLLEPFFSMDVAWEEFSQVASENLANCPVLLHGVATGLTALDVLASSPFAILTEGSLMRGTVTQDDILQLIAEEVCMEEILGGGSSPEVCTTSDFPCSFSSILQKILQSRMSALVVVNDSNVPVGIITVKDVWDYVMQGASILRD